MPLNVNYEAGPTGKLEPAFLVFGKLRRAHGVAGEIALEVYSNLPELIAVNEVVYIGEKHQPYIIKAIRAKGKLLLIKFGGIDDRNAVSALTNEFLFTRTDQLPKLDEDELFLYQLIGLEVYESEGRFLGKLTQILETGANDVYLVKDEIGNEVLIPAVDEFIIDIDLDAEKIVVAKMEWFGEGD